MTYFLITKYETHYKNMATSAGAALVTSNNPTGASTIKRDLQYGPIKSLG